MSILLTLRLVFFVVGIALFFTVQRYLSTESYAAYLNGLAWLLLAAGLLLPVAGHLKAKKESLTNEAKSWLLVFMWEAAVAASLSVYLLYDKLLDNALTPETFTMKALLALWLLLLNLGTFAGIGIELAHKGSGTGQLAEVRRVARSSMAWLMVGMVLTFLVCFNYVGAKKDKAFDWSYLKATSPGEATLKMFKSAPTPVRIILFYPKDSDVRPYLDDYFSFLKKDVPTLSVETVDKDLSPSMAEQFKVSRNGQVILSSGEKQERIDVGTEIREARSILKKLDSEVQKSYLRLLENKKTLYFTRGHGELSWLGSDANQLQSISLLEKFLRSQNYTLKTFGVAEGSASAVPDDAAAVLIVGADMSFMPAEIESLKAYLKKGGSVMVLMDVAKASTSAPNLGDEGPGKSPLVKFLADAGIDFHRKMLANDQSYVSATRSPVDKWFIFSNSFTSHESVTSLAKHDERVALILFQSGYFDLKEKEGDWRTQATVRSLPSTFIDENRNFAFDAPKEVRKSYTLGAAAILENPAAKGAEAPKDKPEDKASKEKPKDEEAKQGKMLAVADATFISDALLRNPGNALFAGDAIKWLTGNQTFVGETSSEEDVKIQHSRKEDVVWFNVTVLGVPVLVLIVGFFATRKKRKKRAS